MWLLLSLHLHGQSPRPPTYSTGDRLPATATQGDLFLWTDNAGLYRWEAKDWERIALPDGVIDVFTCRAMVVAELPMRTSIIFPDFIRNYPVKASVSCWDSVAEVTIGDRFMLVDTRMGKSASERQLTPEVTKTLYATIVIRGVTGWCVPAFHGDMRLYDTKEFKNWGILNARGRWVIEPRYDKPFRFVDGVARVIYYGQKRKINLRGEFVD